VNQTEPNTPSRHRDDSRSDSSHILGEPDPSGSRVLLALAWVLACGLLGFGTWAAYWAELRDDHYQLLYLGQCVFDGGRMYIDCWENKPPGLAWINALGLWLGGGDLRGPWVLPGLTAAVGLAVYSLAASRLFGRTAAMWTVLIGGLLMSMRLYDTPSINPDTYGVQFALSGAAMMLVSVRLRRARCRAAVGFLAGLSWAAGFAIKQTGVLGLIVLTVVALVSGGNRRERRRWRFAALWNWIGFLVGTAAVAFALYRRGILSEAFDATFLFNARYAHGSDLIGALRDWSRATQMFVPMRFALCVALLGLLGVLRAGRVNGLGRAVVLGLLVWFLSEVVLGLMGPSRSVRYWQALWPPVLLACGFGIRLLQMAYRRTRTGPRLVFGLTLGTAMVLLIQPTYLHFVTGASESYLQYIAEDRERDLLERMGRDLRKIVPESEPMFVLGYNAGLYLYSQRPCASRYTYVRSPEQLEYVLGMLERGEAGAVLAPEKMEELVSAGFGPAEQKRILEILEAYEYRGDVQGCGKYRVFVFPDRYEPPS